MANMEFRWMEEGVDDLIALLEEKLCLYNMKLRLFLTETRKGHQ